MRKILLDFIKGIIEKLKNSINKSEIQIVEIVEVVAMVEAGGHFSLPVVSTCEKLMILQ